MEMWFISLKNHSVVKGLSVWHVVQAGKKISERMERLSEAVLDCGYPLVTVVRHGLRALGGALLPDGHIGVNVGQLVTLVESD